LERLSATRARPLFSPTRRPPAPPPVFAPAPPAPPPPPDIVLLAVIMDGEDARVVVRGGRGAKTRRVGIGDDIDGWKVVQIEGQKLVLSLDDRVAKFAMFTGNKASGPPDAGAAMPPVGAQPKNVAQQPSAPSSSAARPVPYSHSKRSHYNQN
jgi:hypothetical protein